MDHLYIDFLHQLEPYRDKVFYHGLSESEVFELETKIGTAFPPYYRAFIRVFGIRQDVVFGLLRRERDVVKRNANVPDELRASYIVIGDNGGEDHWMLRTDNHEDTMVYEWQHWYHGDVVPLGYDFATLIQNSIEQLKNDVHRRVPNDKKRWSVQFALRTNDEQRIYKTIPLARVRVWELRNTSPAHVHKYETAAMLGDNPILFSKLEYEGWSTPLYFFDLEEPAMEYGTCSQIKEIDRLLSVAFPSEYTLVDYGILPVMEPRM